MTSLPTLDTIPHALRERPQWVVWKYETRDDGGKMTKVPYQARYPQRKASSKAPHTWSDVRVALSTASKHGFDGIGYVFSADDPFAGFDLDNILDEQGAVAEWAQPWLAQLPTYTEISPSGRGVKGIVCGKLPGSGVNAGSVEVYDQGRYFAITGQRFDGAPAEPQPVNGALDRLYAFAQERKAQYEAERETRRQRAYAEKALANEADRVRNAPEGMRNDSLNRAAFAVAGFIQSNLLSEDEIVDALADAAGIAGLAHVEIRATLRSGIRAGVEQVRQVPPSQRADVDPTTGEILTPPDTSWLRSGITLSDLQRVRFEPLRWIVQDICPEGVTLIAAKPKAKKSWIALGLGLAVAMGRLAMGKLAVSQGRVLFLDLEGNQRRIQARVRSILGNVATAWPSNFHVHTEWPKGDDCVARIEQWMLAFPDTSMIVIDLLAEIRPPMDPRADRYVYDREMLVTLNKLAEKYHVAIVVIHHTRKAKGEDVFDEVSGTLGINGAVSTLWILSRSQEGHVVLSMTGRDLIRDDPLALAWDGYTCSFVIEGNAADIALSSERKLILDLLADDRAWTPRQIAADIGKSVNAVQGLLRDMLQDGQVDKVGYGKYARIPMIDHGKSSQSGKSGKSGKSGQSFEANSDPTLTNSYHPGDPKSEFDSASGRAKTAQNTNSYHSYHLFREADTDTQSHILQKPIDDAPFEDDDDTSTF